MKKNRTNELLGLLLGNAIEFYDFTVYAFMAPFIKKNIFPHHNRLSGFLLIFSIFSSGYFVRPLGSILFGHIGDKYNRDIALILSVVLATLSTFFIGFVPSYDSFGMYSVVLLLIIRMIQGLSVSGEEGGSTVRIYETLYPNNKGIASSLVISTVFFGVLLGSIVCYGVSTFIERGYFSESLWRLPFMLALPLGFITLTLRLRNNQDKKRRKNTVDYPIKKLLNKRGMITLVSCYAMGAIFSILTAVLFVFVPYYLKSVILISSQESLYIVSSGILISIILSPFFGALSDYFSEKHMFKIGLLLSIALLLIIFPLIRFYYSVGIVFLFFTYITMAMVVPITFSFMLDAFDEAVRYTGMSLALNMAVATFSGALPVMLIYMAQGSAWSPGILIVTLITFFYSIFYITTANSEQYRGVYE